MSKIYKGDKPIPGDKLTMLTCGQDHGSQGKGKIAVIHKFTPVSQ